MEIGLFRSAFGSFGPVGSIVSLPRGMLGKLFQVFWRRGRRCWPGGHMTVTKFSGHLRAFVPRCLYQLFDQLPHSPIVACDSSREEIWPKVGSWIWSKSVYPLHALVLIPINGTLFRPNVAYFPSILTQNVFDWETKF
jgi:hypothetical protein